MKVIDARSGREMKIGDTVRYGDGEELTLLDIDEGLLSANAFVEHTFRDMSQAKYEPSGKRIPNPLYAPESPGENRHYVPFINEIVCTEPGPLVTRRSQIPLQVRLFHPSFFLQRVAFIPS